MKISLNTIQEMNRQEGTAGDIALDGIDKLVEKIGAQLGAVDEVIDFGKKYQGIVVTKIISCEKHGNADKLSVCKIDDGNVVKDVQRDEDGLVQVVCGAPNVRKGILVAWLPPGIIVPSSASKDPFVLEAKDFRGVVSNGMLASLSELAISDDHSGILELSHISTANRSLPKPGDDFAKLYGLNDHIIDIENKMFTHRPDLFGFLGVARELAGIQGVAFNSPEWYTSPKTLDIEAEELKLEVKNELPELVPRFTAITMRDVKIGPSPLWLQIFLAKMGQKSINNIVDYTNYFMHMTGQPLHAYDYDKLARSKMQPVRQAQDKHVVSIEVRKSRNGDTLKLLNGKEITFDNDATILITSGDKPIGIGGVMGGNETEVDETTTNIIIECANFDMYSIRRTAMEHGLFTDAVTRFTKGQSPLQTHAVMTRIVGEIHMSAAGKVAGKLIDIVNENLAVTAPEGNFKTKQGTTPNVFDWGHVSAPITVHTDFINKRLGLNLTSQNVTQLLQNVEISAYEEHPDHPGEIEVIAPFWRTDLEIAEDIVEEIGRLYGYDHLPQILPKRNIVPVGPDGMLKLKQTLRETLARFGANEVLTYSFVDGGLLDKSGQNRDEAYTVSNALSPELQYYRLSLTPSLLSHVHANIKAGHATFSLFELGKTHNKKNKLIGEVPKEIDTLGFVAASADKNISSGSPYFSARSYLDHIAHSLGVELVYYPAERDPDLAMTAPFELSRSAFVTIKNSKGMLGIIGEYKQSVAKNLKLPPYSSGFEVGIHELLAHTSLGAGPAYKPLSRYPGTKQDVCFQIPLETKYQDLFYAVNHALEKIPLDFYLEPVDIYQPESNEYKNITLRLHLTDYTKTIATGEAKAIVDKVSQAAAEQVNAKII